MAPVRRHRRWIAACLAAVVLFAQLATAAYACPGETVRPDAIDTGLSMADMPGCDGRMDGGLDPGQPQLCKAHCQAGQQSVNSQSPVGDPAAPAAVLAPPPGPPDLSLVAPLRSAPCAWHAAGPPRGTPPLYLSLQVLRR